MTPEQLAAIRERLAKASPGPWNADFTDDEFNVLPDNGCVMHNDGNPDGSMRVRVLEADKKDDILFMMYARTDMPALLAEVERLQTENAAMRGMVEWLAAELPDYDATVKMHEEARKLLGISDD